MMYGSQSNAGRGVRGIGRILMILGVLVFVVGAATYIGVGVQLKAEKIPISGDTPFMNSVFGSEEGETPKEVAGPLGAIAQVAVIQSHTEHLPGSYGFEDYNGYTAAEIAHIRSAKEYPGAGGEDADAKFTALWNMMNTSSFLRSSLMLCVLAFGLALLIAGLGVVVFLTGLGLLKAGRGLPGQSPAIGQVAEVVAPAAAPVVVATAPEPYQEGPTRSVPGVPAA
ncbi:MAG: hypothetical protein LBU05_01125 [Bifidobacteriaceae bacterium]|jgi:hypothetical protein|nr:hypothetical protein [Bifidobacteriaceae bacterium]